VREKEKRERVGEEERNRKERGRKRKMGHRRKKRSSLGYVYLSEWGKSECSCF